MRKLSIVEKKADSVEGYNLSHFVYFYLTREQVSLKKKINSFFQSDIKEIYSAVAKVDFQGQASVLEYDIFNCSDSEKDAQLRQLVDRVAKQFQIKSFVESK